MKDGGTISGGEIAAIFADGYDTPAEVYVEGGTVTTMSGNTGIDLKNGAKLVVSKGLVENIKMIGGNGITVGDNSQVNVTGGTITGTHTAIRATSAGSRVSASGGKIKGHLQSIAFKQGCTIDVGEGVTLETDVHPEITGSETVAPTAGESNNISLTIKDSSGNVAGAHESLDYPIIITGYNIVPDSSGGNLGGTALSGTSTLVNVNFLNGAATVPLKLNNAATQKISFYPLGESHKSADLSITPAPAQAKRMMVTTQPTGSSVNGGVLTTQPIVKILDEYGNTVTSDYSTMVTASLHGGHDCLLAGGTTVMAVSGVVSFSDLAAYKLTPGEVTTARLQFTSASLPDTYSSLFTISGDTITTGIIAGRVKDSSDNPVSGAKVSLTVDAVEYSATSAADGSYSIADVPAGTDYTVMASKSGYTSGSTANVSVTANTTTSGVNITLTSDLDGCLVTYRGAQKRYNADTDTYDIRFIATIDTLNAKEVGFVFSKSEPIPTRDNATVKATTTVYTSITAAGVTVTAESLGGKYIVAYTITGIPESDINVPLYVRAFSTVGAETKYTTAVTVTVNSLP
ncbi:carboxypeptidase-like regulatory domain-containing protein [Desulfotomaculum sp. 1211_IL3151]|uniref:carboxypeptidase-like regulatory domain-containing protein n=1 Tax=Desulfotomaculum sp. 1211_IL3151 TaxID=3084055 RepID=UPI002FDB768D